MMFLPVMLADRKGRAVKQRFPLWLGTQVRLRSATCHCLGCIRGRSAGNALQELKQVAALQCCSSQRTAYVEYHIDVRVTHASLMLDPSGCCRSLSQTSSSSHTWRCASLRARTGRMRRLRAVTPSACQAMAQRLALCQLLWGLSHSSGFR